MLPAFHSRASTSVVLPEVAGPTRASVRSDAMSVDVGMQVSLAELNANSSNSVAHMLSRQRTLRKSVSSAVRVAHERFSEEFAPRRPTAGGKLAPILAP